MSMLTLLNSSCLEKLSHISLYEKDQEDGVPSLCGLCILKFVLILQGLQSKMTKVNIEKIIKS